MQFMKACWTTPLFFIHKLIICINEYRFFIVSNLECRIFRYCKLLPIVGHIAFANLKLITID